MSKAKKQAQQFLDDLDSLSPAPPPPSSGSPKSSTPQPAGEAAELLAFMDEITQKSTEPTRLTAPHLERPLSRSGTPTLRKSTERVRMGTPSQLVPGSGTGSPQPGKAEVSGASATSLEKGSPAPAGAGGWGWGSVGSVWSSASAVVQQAKTVVNEQVKSLPQNDQAKKWGEGVLGYAKTAQEYAKTAQLDKLGQDLRRVGLSTFTEILNVVAPPISEHEVIQVWLSHDMEGYEGVETVVYRGLAKIMEQVEGGDLIVNRGDESKPKESSSDKREMNSVEGFDAALKLAQANLDEVIKRNVAPEAPKSSATDIPVTYSYVYLRVQPYTTSFTLPEQTLVSSSPDGQASSPVSRTSLQFILHLSDPGHKLVHSTITQAVPGNWVDIWDKYEWIEDMVVETLRLGVEVLGQEYVAARMGWMEKATDPHAADKLAAEGS